ncbi:MAG: hypothetical protein A2W90_01615 [Bacteroidetes bacterium GWF2_42_66]|nr:MAG: hypothetical protein A2W92_11920 [Bacteroidetes bacterium GWA2_42_15]OFY01385.1 MAG: hypothetical protein A2W89_15100 [Bacteroidetes bacterium GWE2_42_39]OFY42227.1 MAG: hypothetical protein A2W90_01615 [Bacteroidetes bacterium GWF2_42_66]
MKNIIKLITLGLFISVICSCDDYLETESNSTFTEDVVFSNLDFATKAVSGVYQYLAASNSYDYCLGLYCKCDNDIEVTFAANNNAMTSMAHYAADPGTTYLKSTWNLLYSGIDRACICIDNLPKSPIWEGEYADEARQLYGEAVTLRALFYYELVSLWGDVPFPLNATSGDSELYLPKTDRDSIYEYLIQELKEVEDYVPWMTQTSERVTKTFVKGLRARMALAYAGYSLRNTTFETRRGRYWEEYYKIANQECKEIIESGKHQLNPDFGNIFKTLHAYKMDMTYKEIIFEIAFGRLVSGRVGTFIGMTHLRASPDDPKYGRANAEIKVPVNYFYSFNRLDKRRNVSVELYNYNSASNVGKQVLVTNAITITPCKWRKSWINPTMGGDLASANFTGVNWPLMRYSDIVLMYAESENEINGPTPAAKEALSLIRQRAFPQELWASKVTNYVDSVATSKDGFFNAIVDERAWEFGGEMLRKYDLVRWNLLGSKINKMKEEVTQILTNNSKFSFVPDYIFWKTKEDNETIDILNPDYRISSTSITGYTRTSWYPKTSTSTLATYQKSMGYVANGYNETKNNHLYPIAAEIITASNGTLTNDQIP